MQKISLILIFSLLLVFVLAACSPSPAPSPAPSDPASPTLAPSASSESAATITVTVFLDLNRDGQSDPGEPGAADQVGLAPDTDCTIGDPAVILPAETDPASGEFTYSDLAPGRYCVLYRGDQPLTTEPAVTLTLQPGQQASVAFGREP